jgi:hypothetical protein
METQLNPKHEAWTIFLVEWVCEHEWHLITLMVYQYSHPPFRRGSTQSRMCEISTNLTSQQEESNTVHNKSTLNELYPAPKKKPLWISEPCLTDPFVLWVCRLKLPTQKMSPFLQTTMLLYLSLELYFFFIASKSKHSQTL